MTMHQNSLSAFACLNVNKREAMVPSAYVEAGLPQTDREIMLRLGFSEPNTTRPRITRLVQIGALKEAGNALCSVTNRKVRICQISPAALEQLTSDK
jgi:hypothetical protein